MGKSRHQRDYEDQKDKLSREEERDRERRRKREREELEPIKTMHDNSFDAIMPAIIILTGL